MEVSFKKISNSRAEIFFRIKKEELGKFREMAISKLSQDFRKEGFRPGKAPREAVEKEIGEIRILEEAVKEIVKENYSKIISENKVQPLSQPEVEVLPPTNKISGEGFEFKASFFIFPEIKLADYKKIASKTKKNKALVEEKEIEDALHWIQKSRAKLTLKNQPAQKGDFVEIDFSSPQIESGLKRRDGFILGEGQFVFGFEDNLVGMINSQEKEFSLTFPKDHPKKDMAGKKFDFKVKVVSVQKAELPEINDEWARSLGNFNELASLKNNIREGLKKEKEISEGQRIRQEILEKLSEKSEVEVPEILIGREKNISLDGLKTKVAEVLKIPFEEYLAKINKTEKEIRDSFSEEARMRSKYDLILREISLKENISVTEDEMKEEINKIVKSLSISGTKELDLEALKSYIESEIKKEKTFKFLENLSI
jgi:trigger factor